MNLPLDNSQTNQQRIRKLLLITGPVLVAILGTYFFLNGGRYVSTENAFLKADKVMVSAEVSGRVTEILVTENTPVTLGQPLFRLDETPMQTAVDRAHAHLQKVQSDIAALKASYQQKMAELQLAQSTLAYTQREYRRNAEVAGKHFISQTALDASRHNADLAAQQINVIQQDLLRIKENLAGNPEIPVEQHPSYLEAQADYTQALLNLAHATVKAPFDGIANSLPKAGQYLNAGTPAMALVASNNMWIEANFNETELTHVLVGQAVEIEVDTYPDVTWHGTVQSISPATGAEFSILPPQNATGNWVKVVQRIPVRIALVPQEKEPQENAPQKKLPELRVGMSTTVNIDTGNQRLKRWFNSSAQ